MVLVPRGGAALAERTQEIRSDLASALIVERQFLHPIDGPDPVHLRHRPRRRDVRGLPATTSATRRGRSPIRPRRALLLRDGDEARLVMRDGVALALSAGRRAAQLGRLRPVRVRPQRADPAPTTRARRGPSEYSVRELLNPTAEMLAGSNDRARAVHRRGALQADAADAGVALSDDRAGDAARRRLPAQRLRAPGDRRRRGRGAAAVDRHRRPARGSRTTRRSGR